MDGRAFVLVADACGVGALPDAASYGDEGTNTLAHVADAVGGLRLPTMAQLGLGSILTLRGVAPAEQPAIYGRLHPLGPGKDSTTGHRELMGVVLAQPAPTYPDGFPPEVLARLVAATGREMICNRAYNGIEAIADFGAEHLRTGALILYTSQDSVLQLAAHVERVPPQELYRACQAARQEMSGEHAVGRVIARPFSGEPGGFARTDGRRDFALVPPSRSYLEELLEAGVEVHGVGKIEDLFAGVGVTHSHAGATNARALQSLEVLSEELERGLVFVNLIETDQRYGHRKDVAGFAGALAELDAHLARLLPRLRDRDLLIVTADHGVDPLHAGTDHTREYAPLLAVTGEMLAKRVAGAGYGGFRHDGPLADVGASVLAWLTGRRAEALPGESFVGGGPARRAVLSWRRARAARGRDDPRAARAAGRGTPADACRGARSALVAAAGARRAGRGAAGPAGRVAGTARQVLLWNLSDEVHLVQHLRMTGAVLLDPKPQPAHISARLRLGARRLVIADQRRFGTGELVLGDAALAEFFATRLGVEPFDDAFTGEYLRERARGRIGPIKSFLLDQRHVAGIGNIYADEALFRAYVHPLRAAGVLKRSQYALLRDSVRAALQAGIDAKGASIDDFRHVDGVQGAFQNEFLVHLRAGEPCVRCGTTIVKLVVGGRGTYVCEHCQPRPRVRRKAAVR